MVMTDPIADLLTRIRNANAVRHEVVEVPSSTVKKAIANILLQEGYLKGIEEFNDGVVPMLRLSLKYASNKILVDREARKAGLGGEVICYVW